MEEASPLKSHTIRVFIPLPGDRLRFTSAASEVSAFLRLARFPIPIWNFYSSPLALPSSLPISLFPSFPCTDYRSPCVSRTFGPPPLPTLLSPQPLDTCETILTKGKFVLESRPAIRRGKLEFRRCKLVGRGRPRRDATSFWHMREEGERRERLNGIFIVWKKERRKGKKRSG